jgi:hypothetical protein
MFSTTVEQKNFTGSSSKMSTISEGIARRRVVSILFFRQEKFFSDIFLFFDPVQYFLIFFITS